MTPIQAYQSYHIGSKLSLTESQIQQLVYTFQHPVSPVNSVLGGRNAISKTTLEDIGQVVIKHYTRGGFIRKFNEQTYLRTGTTRCQAEFELLAKLKNIGVNVPDPVAFAHQGTLFYHAWLISKEITDVMTLAELSVNEPDRAKTVMASVNHQISVLIENRIHHVDMHPGNILFNQSNKIYLIDFDKARTDQSNHHRLREKYLQRWQRAVAKHQLPEILNKFNI